MDLLAPLYLLLQRHFGIPAGTSARLLASAVTLFVFLVVRRLGRRIVARTVADNSSRYTANNVIAYTAGLLAIAALVRIWTEGVTGVATYLGLASAGVAIALRDPLINLVGWLFIVVRQPFSVGDRIQIGPHTGDVVDIRLFRFIMLEVGNWVHADQGTGRSIQIPNGWVFQNAIQSYDQPFGHIWNELEVLLTFESNWRKAKEVLTKTVTEHAEKLSPDAQDHLEKAAEHLHLRFPTLTPVVWSSVSEGGIRLTMRYLCRPRERRSSESEIWESVLEALGALPDVEFARPTVRFENAAEVKRPAESAGVGAKAK